MRSLFNVFGFFFIIISLSVNNHIAQFWTVVNLFWLCCFTAFCSRWCSHAAATNTAWHLSSVRWRRLQKTSQRFATSHSYTNITNIHNNQGWNNWDRMKNTCSYNILCFLYTVYLVFHCITLCLPVYLFRQYFHLWCISVHLHFYVNKLHH